MRVLIRQLAFLALLLLVSQPRCPAQQSFKGQLHVSDVDFTVRGSMLQVRMRVSYDRNLLVRGETLNFTPVIKTGGRYQALSSVVVPGRGDDSLVRGNFPVAVLDSRGGAYHFDYDTTVPYWPWMRGAELYAESDELSRSGEHHTYEDCLLGSIDFYFDNDSNDSGDGPDVGSSGDPAGEPAPAPATAPASSADAPGGGPSAAPAPAPAPVSETVPVVVTARSADPVLTHAEPSWIQILEPGSVPRKELRVTGTIPLADIRRIGSLGTGKFNRMVLSELDQALAPAMQVPGTTIKRLSVSGYGAPVGNYRRNEVRSTARALELKRFLLSEDGGRFGSVDVNWIAEDWDSIYSSVSASTLRMRDAAVNIMRNVSVPMGREEQLEMLDGGTLYEYLSRYVFPLVCRIEFTAELSRESATPVPLTAQTQPVGLMEMYDTAMGYAKGSLEFGDMLDLAARLYPTSVEANVNAAGVALMRGNLSLAEAYLNGLGSEPRAYNNLGVYHLLRGETAKAEIYLRMALSQGVGEASLVLASMQKYK